MTSGGSAALAGFRARIDSQRTFSLVSNGGSAMGSVRLHAFVRRTAVAVVAAAGLVALPAATARAAAPACAPTAATATAAASLARACGARVEVMSERTATAQVFADPSGSTVAEIGVVPTRMKRAD